MNDDENTPEKQALAALKRIEFQIARSSEIVEAQQARIDATLNDLRALRCQSQELTLAANELKRAANLAKE